MARHTSSLRSSYLFDVVAIALLLAFALIVAYPRWRADIDWRDEGLLAFGAVRVAQGEIPHRDFVSVQPPLSYYTTAGAFKLGGTSLVSLRMFGVLIFVLVPLLLYGIARVLKNGPVLSACSAGPACVLGLPYVYFVPLAAWQGIASSLAAVFLFICALLTGRKWLAAPAGLLTATSSFLRHDQAVYTVISMLVLVATLSFVRDAAVPRTQLKRVVLFWLAGSAVIGIPAFIIWWTIGAVPETFKQLVVFPFATYAKTSSLPFPSFTAGKSLAERLVVLLFYLPAIIQVIAAIYIMGCLWQRRFGFRQAVIVFLVAWSALFYLQVLVRSDQTHLLLTLPPFFLLSASLISVVQQAIARRITNIVFASAAALAAVSYLWLIRSILLPDVSHATELLALDRAGVRVAQARVINSFVKSLQTYAPPTESMLALPYQPMFYFLAERRNPTRWNYLWPGDQTTQDHERFVEQAKHDPPAVILLSDEDEVGRYAPVIASYIKSQYVRTAMVGRLAIYVRRDAE